MISLSMRMRCLMLGIVALAGAAHAAPGARPGVGQFLAASRAMADPRFVRTVVLLVAHGPDGALGVVVNRPTKLSLARALPELRLDADSDRVLWYGGPVEHQRAGVLVASPVPPQPSIEVVDGLHYSSNFDALLALVAPGRDTPGQGSRFRVYAGYAGWGPGQLEAEIARGDWTLHPASVAQVFDHDGEALWRTLSGAAGTWVRYRTAPRSGVFALHPDPTEVTVAADVEHDQHRPAAHAAVLHVSRVAGGAVEEQLHRLPAVRAGH